MSHSSVVKASEVTGVKVKNLEKVPLGEIAEIVIDKISGKTNYLVLDFGGILGFGNKFFAIPWHLFTYDPSEDCFLLNIEKAHLEKAPGFDKNHWPNFADAQFTGPIHKYYE